MVASKTAITAKQVNEFFVHGRKVIVPAYDGHELTTGHFLRWWPRKAAAWITVERGVITVPYEILVKKNLSAPS